MERFYDKVDRSPGQGPEGTCWGWTGCCIRDGYGHFRFQGGAIRAHRLAWQLENGEIPDGKCVLHRCDNPRCVNPSHLFLGTVADNNRDMREKGRHLAGHRERGRKQQGEKNPCAKLTDDLVLEIRREYADGGVTQQALADRYGMHRATIGRALQGKIWRHLL